MSKDLQISKIGIELSGGNSEERWEYVGGVFDSKANIILVKTNGGLSLRIQFKNLPLNFLKWLKSFLGYGSLYFTNRNKPILSISKKHHLFDLLLNVQKETIIKKELVKYLLDNYSPNIGITASFDIQKFKALKNKD